MPDSERLPIVEDFYEFDDHSIVNKSVAEAIDVDEVNIYEIFGGEYFYIPDYQRDYGWKEKQRTEFWEAWSKATDLPDPSDSIESVDLIGVYFGAAYFATREVDDRDRLEVVDGQQRLTTVVIAAKVLKELISELKSEIGSSGPTLDNIEFKLDRVVMDRSGTPTPSVQMSEHDHLFFRALIMDPGNDGDIVDYLETRLERDRSKNYDGRYKEAKEVEEVLEDTKNQDLKSEFDTNELETHIYFGESHRLLLESYNTFHKGFDDIFEKHVDPEDAANQKANIVRNMGSYLLNMFIINMCEINKDIPKLRYDIFESLNGKGLDLHVVDHIRARLVNRVEGETRQDVIENWDEFTEKFGRDNDTIENVLGYYVAATEERPNTISDANDMLLDVFSNENDLDNLRARLEKPEETKNLIQDINSFGSYFKDLDMAETARSDTMFSDEEREEIKNIFKRLNKLRFDQWRVLGTFVYKEVDNDHGREDLLIRTLRAIETLSLRQSISGRSGAGVEGTYVETVESFRERLNDDERDDEFDAELLVTDLTNEADSEFFGTNMANTLIDKTNWSNDALRVLFQHVEETKQRREIERGEREEKDRSILVLDNLDIEHVLPKSPIFDDSTSERYRWLKEFFRTEHEDTPMSNAVETIIDQDVDDLEIKDSDTEEIERIKKQISKRFICDISNTIFLLAGDNRAEQNSLFSRKLKTYLDNDWDDRALNSFFSRSGDLFGSGNPIPEEKLREFEDHDIDSSLDQTDYGSVSDIEQIINGSWNYENMFEGKKEQVKTILDHLVFETDPSEFSGDVESDIETQIERDKQRRINRQAF